MNKYAVLIIIVLLSFVASADDNCLAQWHNGIEGNVHQYDQRYFSNKQTALNYLNTIRQFAQKVCCKDGDFYDYSPGWSRWLNNCRPFSENFCTWVFRDNKTSLTNKIVYHDNCNQVENHFNSLNGQNLSARCECSNRIFVSKNSNYAEDLNNIDYNLYMTKNSNKSTITGTAKWTGEGLKSDQFTLSITASNENSLTLNGPSNMISSNLFPQSNIPYIFITRIEKYQDLFKIIVTIHFNKFGKEGKLEIQTTNHFNEFVSEAENLMGKAKNLFEDARKSLVESFATLKSNDQNVNKLRSSIQNIDESKKERNSKIFDLIKNINNKNEEIKSAQLLFSNLQSSIQRLNDESVKSFKMLESCQSDLKMQTELLKTYSNYNQVYPTEKLYDVLNQETTNLCKFHLANQELPKVLPSLSYISNEAGVKLIKEQKAKEAIDILNSNEFYINLE